MNGSVVRASSSAARTWRMRQWPNDPTIAHLIFTDHQSVPSRDDVAAAVEHARHKGARALRTSALFPSAADVVLAHGFEPIDRLALLQRTGLDALEPLPPSEHRIRPMLAWHRRAVAEVDRAAFGPMWGNDAASLRDIRRATPQHRARLVTSERRIVGFAISGAAGPSGYLQRIAVHPSARRRGLANSLVADALAWMARHGRSDCLVNTGVDNEAALALYDRLGFERLADVLTIAEHRFSR